VELCGICDYSDKVLRDFAPAVRIHLNQMPQSRKALTYEEKLELMNRCGLICPECGKPLLDINFDHILPFFLVYDTLDLANRQCLCPECNRDKGSAINVEERLCA
jgi:5-methylcytosine-specific restriction endonuclease McrA